jgi:hypothetical protein
MPSPANASPMPAPPRSSLRIAHDRALHAGQLHSQGNARRGYGRAARSTAFERCRQDLCTELRARESAEEARCRAFHWSTQCELDVAAGSGRLTEPTSPARTAEQ